MLKHVVQKALPKQKELMGKFLEGVSDTNQQRQRATTAPISAVKRLWPQPLRCSD
jgi:hypothetical protein